MGKRLESLTLVDLYGGMRRILILPAYQGAVMERGNCIKDIVGNGMTYGPNQL